ncbi:hypothetical protein HC928_02695 [bacterium]|nr:hypothetical protein [bacterium]
MTNQEREEISQQEKELLKDLYYVVHGAVPLIKNTNQRERFSLAQVAMGFVCSREEAIHRGVLYENVRIFKFPSMEEVKRFEVIMD